jgi:CMP-N-acetylneuraminic acid synthetase
MRDAVCLIPARGGSKRIIGKNIIDFCGKPLLYWTIKQAQKSDCFKGIYVSSDSDEILDIASFSGATPYKRRDDLCKDDTLTEEVVIDFFDEIKLDTVIVLQPTNPLRRLSDIVNAVENNKAFGVTKYVPNGHGYDNLMTTGLVYKCLKGAMQLMPMNEYPTIQMVAPWQSFEIDYENDLKICELLFIGMGLDKEVE